jgi:hypothetical protein
VPQIVQADGLDVVAVESGRVPGRVHGTERVAARLRLPGRGREHERVTVDEAQVDARLSKAVRS